MNSEVRTSEGQSAIRGLKDDVKDGKTTGGASIRNTHPIQALVGVRVVASLLGHSRIETLCSRAKAQVGQWGLGEKWPDALERNIWRRSRRVRGRRGLDRSDPC